MAADDFGCGAGGDRRRRLSTPTRRSCLCCGRWLFEEESGRGFAEMAADDFGCGGATASLTKLTNLAIGDSQAGASLCSDQNIYETLRPKDAVDSLLLF